MNRDRFGGTRGYWTCPICSGPARRFVGATIIFGSPPIVMAARSINGVRCDACDLEQVDQQSAKECAEVTTAIRHAAKTGWFTPTSGYSPTILQAN